MSRFVSIRAAVEALYQLSAAPLLLLCRATEVRGHLHIIEFRDHIPVYDLGRLAAIATRCHLAHKLEVASQLLSALVASHLCID